MNPITKSPSKSAQAANLIKAEIESLGLVPGQRLVTAREFAKRFSVSKQVVQSAFSILEREGIIETRPRSGTFVAPGAIKEYMQNISGSALGLLLHSSCGGYGMSVIKAMHEYASARSMTVVTASVNDFGKEALEKVAELRGAGCLAVMIPWTPINSQKELAGFLSQSILPVAVTTYIKGFEKNSVKSSQMLLGNTGSNRKTGDTQLSYDACDYFYRTGEKNIVLLGTKEQEQPSMRDKISGYSKYMDSKGLPKRIELVGLTAKEMDQAAARVASLKEGAAVFAYVDSYAIRFMTAMHKLGLCAPHDFKIISDDNSAGAKYCDPPLTSAQADFSRIGAEIVKCAFALSQGAEWHSSWIGPKEIVVRSSCGGAQPQSRKVLEAMKEEGVRIRFDDVAELVDQ